MISVVICTFNGKSRISSCLTSLVAQENAPEFELVVVDNGSTDDTGGYVQEFLSENFSSRNWKLVVEVKPGLLQARIKGLKEANYNWVLFCDDDNVLFPDFLNTCQELLKKNKKIGVLGSHGIPEIVTDKPDWFDTYSSSFAVGPQLTDKSQKRHLDFVYGACSIYLKQPLLQLFEKGFAPVLSGRKQASLSSGDDVEWCALMQLLGYQIAYSPRLKFYHQIPESRLTWEYYLTLKKGITSGAGLLLPYHFFFQKTIHHPLAFRWAYFKEKVKAGLLFLKYRVLWKGKPSSPENQLAYLILETKYRSFRENKSLAIRHFNQICRHFGA